ncbi:MAG: glycoside hydrolase family 25 [Butyrivibrio sp.]|nr:glycoside hydrolase family 25 [Butyrivibrio sp.]
MKERHHGGKDADQTRTKIIIGGCAVVLCLAFTGIGFLLGKGKAKDEDIEVEVVEETEVAEEAATVATTVEELEVDESSSGDSEEAEDPQTDAVKETGAKVDVAKLVNASNVGETSSVSHGIDVSKFQGTIDWAQVAGSGIDFVMVRVGYRDSSTGEIKADTNAKFNMQEAEKNGIKIGAYFFSTAVNTGEAVEEAEWVANYISKYPITYPVGFNCEGFESASSRQINLTKEDRSAIATAFLDKIYSAGYTPIFYASKNEIEGDAKWNTSQIEQKYKIWMAWYNQDTSNVANKPAYGGQCAMWQYTNQGTVPGIKKPVDVDVAYFGYSGTEVAKDTSERETATADVEALMKFNPVEETVTAKSSTNLRDKPSQGSDSNVMLTLQNGQTATRTGISDSGWSRVVYDGKPYYAISSYLTTDLSAPKQEQPAQQAQDSSGIKTRFTDCNDTVTAKELVNLRTKPSVTDPDSTVAASIHAGENITRTGINNEYGWSRVDYNGQTLYCVTSYLKVVE